MNNQAIDLLPLVALGGLLGLMGQGVRVLAGLRKLAESKKSFPDEVFDGQRFAISLLLGFIAGALGIINLMEENGKLEMTKSVCLTIVGIGYAGVDFIEAFLTKYGMKSVGPPTSEKDDDTEKSLEESVPSTPRAELPYGSK